MLKQLLFLILSTLFFSNANAQATKRLLSVTETYFINSKQKWELIDSIHHYYGTMQTVADSVIRYRNQEPENLASTNFLTVTRFYYKYYKDSTVFLRQHKLGNVKWINAYKDVYYGDYQAPYYLEHYNYPGGVINKISETYYTYDNNKLKKINTYSSFESNTPIDSGYINYYYNSKEQLVNEERYIWVDDKQAFIGSYKKTYVYKDNLLDTMYNHHNSNTGVGEPEWYINTYNSYQYFNNGLLVDEYRQDYANDRVSIRYRYRYEYLTATTTNGNDNVIGRDTSTPVPAIVNEDLKLYPNPTQEIITFNRLHADRVTIYDMNGKLIESYLYPKSNLPIKFNIQFLAAGVYTVVFEEKGFRKQFKLIKL